MINFYTFLLVSTFNSIRFYYIFLNYFFSYLCYIFDYTNKKLVLYFSFIILFNILYSNFAILYFEKLYFFHPKWVNLTFMIINGQFCNFELVLCLISFDFKNGKCRDKISLIFKNFN